MAGYLRWVAQRFESLQERKRIRFLEIRSQLMSGGTHARTPGIVADLLLGVEFFLQFAVDQNALGQHRANDYSERCQAALIAAFESQRSNQAANDPVRQFLALVTSLLATHRVRLNLLDDSPIISPVPRRQSLRFGMYSAEASTPIIGWRNEEDIFLDPETTFAIVQKFAVEQGDAIPLTKTTLIKRMKESGLIVVEPSQGTNMHRLPSPNRHIRAIRLARDVIRMGDSDAEPDVAIGPALQLSHSPPAREHPRM